MGYRIMGRAHAMALRARSRLAGSEGQGTVEYVGLILLIGVVLAGVVAAGAKLDNGGLATTIIDKLKSTISGLGDG